MKLNDDCSVQQVGWLTQVADRLLPNLVMNLQRWLVILADTCTLRWLIE